MLLLLYHIPLVCWNASSYFNYDSLKFLVTLLQASNFNTRWPPTAVWWFRSQHHTAHIRSWLCQPQQWEPCTACQDSE